MAVNKKKIAFHLNSMEQGGAERVVSTLANKFIEKYEVIITTMWFSENEYALDKRIRRVHVGLTERQEKRGRLYQILARNINLRKFLKREKPDILISFAKKANYRALFSAIGTRVPVIVSVRANPYGFYDEITDKILIPILYPKASGSVFQTKGAKDFFSPKIQRKSKIILNPISPLYLNTERSKHVKKEIVHTGRIDKIKNQKMLIDSFYEVHQKHPEYTLKIYGMDSGDGTWEYLEQSIKSYKAEKYIFLMGGCKNLDKVLPEASMFVFTSDDEGLPNSVMEAMAVGLPVISTDCPCGGPATLIQNEENGLLIPVGDVDALTKSMNRLIENPEFAEALGRKAQKIKDIASVDEISRQWEEYICEIWNGRER